MNKSNFLNLNRILVSSIIGLIFFGACNASDNPAIGAKEFADSFWNKDMNRMLARSCSPLKQTIQQNAQNDASGRFLGSMIGEAFMPGSSVIFDEVQQDVDTSELKYVVLSNDGTVATVRMGGPVRVTRNRVPQEIYDSAIFSMQLVDGLWRVCETTTDNSSEPITDAASLPLTKNPFFVGGIVLVATILVAAAVLWVLAKRSGKPISIYGFRTQILANVPETLKRTQSDLAQTAKRGQFEFDKIQRVDKIKSSISALQRQQDVLYAKLGRATIELHDSGGSLPSELQTFIDQVKDTRESIKNKNTELNLALSEGFVTAPSVNTNLPKEPPSDSSSDS